MPREKCTAKRGRIWKEIIWRKERTDNVESRKYQWRIQRRKIKYVKPKRSSVTMNLILYRYLP